MAPDLTLMADSADPDSTAFMLEARTLRGSTESGHRAGVDGHKRTKGSKVHAAVDTLCYLLARRVTPADPPERVQVGELAEAVQEATGWSVELAVVRLPDAKKGFVLRPGGARRRGVVAPSSAWAARLRRLAKDDDRLPETVAGLHFVAFACLMLHTLLLPPAAVHDTL